MMLFNKPGWNGRQKQLHKKLYLQYRKEELIWHLDIFLSVNHPEWAVKRFLDDFLNNRRTIRQMFMRGLAPAGMMDFYNMLPFQQDMDRFIGFMHYRQYIHITENMTFSEIMKLDRIFDMSADVRQILRFKLLNPM